MAFIDVLDRELASFQRLEALAEPRAAHPLPPAPPHPFLFAAQQRHFGAAVYGSIRGRSVGPLSPPINPAPPPPRPARRLTALEQRALRELVEHGANLRADFTLPELRSAFRMLARRYHPDRHPGSSDAEKSRLARIFATLREHHRCLAGALERTAGWPS